jgi:hypothetical protein
MAHILRSNIGAVSAQKWYQDGNKSGGIMVRFTALMAPLLLGPMAPKNGGKMASFITKIVLLLFTPMGVKSGILRVSAIALMALHT